MYFGHGVRTNLCSHRNLAIAVRVLLAFPRTIEREAVICALDRVTDKLAQMQRNKSVRATILQGNRRAIRLSVKHNQLI
jgi:hypothetical protein